MKNIFGLLFCLSVVFFFSCASDSDGSGDCNTCELSIIGGFGTVEEICDLGDGTLSRVVTTNGVTTSDTITGALSAYVESLEAIDYECN